jgi:hypothetical protein
VLKATAEYSWLRKCVDGPRTVDAFFAPRTYRRRELGVVVLRVTRLLHSNATSWHGGVAVPSARTSPEPKKIVRPVFLLAPGVQSKR